MTGLIRVDGAAYDQALENAVRLTGLGGLEAQWLVQAVLAPALLAPKDLMINRPSEYYLPFEHTGPVPGQDCPWGYLMPSGEVICCQIPDPGSYFKNPRQHREGWHEGAPGTKTWREDDPRSVNILQWRGETE